MEFDTAVSRFRDSSFALVGPVSQLKPDDQTLRAHAALTAYDVYSCCNTLRAAYLAMHDELRTRLADFNRNFADWPQGDNVSESEYEAFWARHVERLDAERNTPEYWARAQRDKEKFLASARGEGPSAAAGVAIKALLLFLRAHQDSLCALIFLAHAPRGTANGEYSMARHLSDHRLVHSFLERELPVYEEWFWRWREFRNRVKRGVSFGSAGSWEAVSITFSTIIPESGGTAGGQETVGLVEMIEALDISAKLHEAITRRAEKTLSLASGKLPAA